MSANSFGTHFRITTFGESHGPAMGVIVDGCPSRVPFDLKVIELELKKRRPGLLSVVSSRNEPDSVEVLSGIYNGQTLGTPIAMLVRNQDARSTDYDFLKHEAMLVDARVGHADDVWRLKFGCSDPRGGGRASGRETVARVMAGAVAQLFLKTEVPPLKVTSWLAQVGPLEVHCPPLDPTGNVIDLLKQAKEQGESYGAKLVIEVSGVPVGLGQPVFHKLKADLATALFGVGGVHALDFGLGEKASVASGTEFHSSALGTESERYGGVRGGISTGETLYLSVTFKPTASILDVAKRGRHDPCIALRASVVVENMVYLVLADHVLWQRLDQCLR